MFEMKEPSEMTPKETVNEIAFVLAAGYLRMLKSQQNKAFTSEKALDSSRDQSVHEAK